MPPIVKCKTCGSENILGQLFCKQCGARLKMGGTVEQKKVKGSGLRIVKTLLRIAVLLACIALVGGLLWPAQPSGEFGSERHADVYEEKIGRLEQAVREGYSTVEEVAETQINGYFARLVTRNSGEGDSASQLGIGEINFAFQQDTVIVFVLARRGPLTLTYELTTAPVADKGLQLNVRQVRLGHIRLPGFLHQKVLKRMAVVFSQMDAEQLILKHLQKIKLDDKRAVLTT